ncbi:MAG: glycosyltransferase family 2 protein [Alphaproteobacteria bacterium]|nr:glycosyltransferase family 2 protein [Alphaproteobacteria bacterium SS10]
MFSDWLKEGFLLAGQLDWQAAFYLFWPLFLFDLPRFTLSTLAVGLTWALVRRPPAPSRREVPVSVLLVGHNEGSRLPAAVRTLRRQTQENIQIVVIDDGSTDDMSSVARRLKRQGLIDDYRSTDLRGGKAAALNLGFSLCKHDVLVSCDIDTSFDDDAIERIVARLLSDDEIGAVSGNIAARNVDDNLITRFQAIEYLDNISLGRQFLDQMDWLMIVSGAFGAFRREAVERVGGWDVGPGDDSNLTIKLRRAGWKVGFAEDAWCLTNVPDSDLGVIRQRMRWDRSLIRNRFRKFRSVFSPTSKQFRWRDIFASVNALFFNVLLPFSWLLYLPYVVIFFPHLLVPLVLFLWAVYTTMSAFTFFTCALVAPRRGMHRLWIYIPGYSVYVSFFLRFIRIAACFTELAFRSSYKDSFYPEKVRRSVQQW